jgi:2-amino-4-hydroxy-6-hydroxymethyldihydropteridine diphosphokinase
VGLALGGNIGDPAQRFREALADLERCLDEIEVAPLYRSAALSALAQPDYLNTVVVARTRLSPESLLAVTKALEWRAGRRPGPRLAPRPLDIDLLFYEGHVAEHPELCIPHPHVAERRFVLQPLADLVPEMQLRPGGATVRELLAALPQDPCVEQVPWPRP